MGFSPSPHLLTALQELVKARIRGTLIHIRVLIPSLTLSELLIPQPVHHRMKLLMPPQGSIRETLTLIRGTIRRLPRRPECRQLLHRRRVTEPAQANRLPRRREIPPIHPVHPFTQPDPQTTRLSSRDTPPTVRHMRCRLSLSGCSLPLSITTGYRGRCPAVPSSYTLTTTVQLTSGTVAMQLTDDGEYTYRDLAGASASATITR